MFEGYVGTFLDNQIHHSSPSQGVLQPVSTLLRPCMASATMTCKYPWRQKKTERDDIWPNGIIFHQRKEIRGPISLTFSENHCAGATSMMTWDLQPGDENVTAFPWLDHMCPVGSSPPKILENIRIQMHVGILKYGWLNRKVHTSKESNTTRWTCQRLEFVYLSSPWSQEKNIVSHTFGIIWVAYGKSTYAKQIHPYIHCLGLRIYSPQGRKARRDSRPNSLSK